MENIKIIEKLGRAGGYKNREKMRQEWNKKYGEDNWDIFYQYNNEIYTRDQGLEEFYNKSYCEYLKQHQTTLNNICNMAKELYNPHAVATGGVDLQVPAMYKSIERLGRKLQGSERIAIGTWGYKNGIKYPSISWELSPFKIPLWCDKNISVESFWQNYKYLGVKEAEKEEQSFLIKEIKRNIFTVDKEKFVFAQCIGKDCRMGAGIALEFDKIDFNMKQYVKKNAIIGKSIKYKSLLVGTVYNMVTKDLSWKAAKVPGKDYYKDRECIPYGIYLNNLRSCLEDLRNQMLLNNELYLAMPKIASGMDKCRWEDVREIIEEVFRSTNIKVLICEKK